MKPLGRHELDRLARAIVSGERGLGVRRDRLLDAAARRMRSKLEAAGAPGATRSSTAGSMLRPEEVAIVSALIARAEKHVAWAAMKAVHGGAHPR